VQTEEGEKTCLTDAALRYSLAAIHIVPETLTTSVRPHCCPCLKVCGADALTQPAWKEWGRWRGANACQSCRVSEGAGRVARFAADGEQLTGEPCQLGQRGGAGAGPERSRAGV
jgi:hypothetical protein